MLVRISAADWAEGGTSEDEVLVIAQVFKYAGADVINVSTGNTVANQNPVLRPVAIPRNLLRIGFLSIFEAI